MEQQCVLPKSFNEELIENCLALHYNGLCRMAYRYVHNEQDAQDIVQESAYKAMKHCGNLREPEHVGTWLYQIVRNESLSFLRRQKESIPLCELDGGIEPHYADVDLQYAIAQLPAAYKTVVLLRFFGGLSFTQMAEALKENINTVKSRLYRALQKLRMLLEGTCAML